MTRWAIESTFVVGAIGLCLAGAAVVKLIVEGL